MEGIAILYVLAMLVSIILKKSREAKSQKNFKGSPPDIRSRPQDFREKDDIKRNSLGAEGSELKDTSFQEQKQAMNTAYENLLNQWHEAEGKMKKGLSEGGHSFHEDNSGRRAKKQKTAKAKAKLNEESSSKKSKALFQEPQKYEEEPEEMSPEGRSFMEAYLDDPKQSQEGIMDLNPKMGDAFADRPGNFLEAIHAAGRNKDHEAAMWRQAILMSEIIGKPVSLRKKAQ